MNKVCGAKARTKIGEPCQRAPLKNGKCRLHGGLSTGPKTQEGKARARGAVLRHGFYSEGSLNESKFITECLRVAQKFLSSIIEGV